MAVIEDGYRREHVIPVMIIEGEYILEFGKRCGWRPNGQLHGRVYSMDAGLFCGTDCDSRRSLRCSVTSGKK
jgi:hypothetical protein